MSPPASRPPTGTISTQKSWMRATLGSGVSAQALGVDGGKSLLKGGEVTGSVKGLKQEEPERYGNLNQPGDQYSYDIYDQIAFGLRDTPSKVLGPLRPQHILAVGESQSAAYLTTFVDTLEPHDYPYNGIFIHSRGGAGAPLNGASISAGSTQTPLLIRTDLRVPVFMSETQTDMILLGYAPAQQPDTDRHPDLGDRRDVPRRHLRGGRERSLPRVYDADQHRPATSGAAGRVR